MLLNVPQVDMRASEYSLLRLKLKKNNYNYHTLLKYSINPFKFRQLELFMMPYKIKEESKTSVLIFLFFLGLSLKKKRLYTVFTRLEVDLLTRMNILVDLADTHIKSNFLIIPYKNYYFLSDFKFEGYSSSKSHKYDRVYPVSQDSIDLYEASNKIKVNKTLDLCTGTGIQAILASSYSNSVIAVDINKRAVRFAQFNALLNGIKNVIFVQSDLYDKLPQLKYDLILANPPYEISFKRSSIFRDGGVQGISIIKRIFNGIPLFLNKSGTCEIVTRIPELSNSSRMILFFQWLQKDNFKVRFLEIYKVDIFHNIMSEYLWRYPIRVVKNISQDMKRHVDLYRRNHIKYIGYGILKVKRANTFSYSEETYNDTVVIPISTQSKIERMMNKR